MSASRRRLSGESDRIEINISPMIDCVFILLIFFIVTTVFVEEEGLAVNKPQAAASQSLDKDLITIKITQKGQILYENRSIGLSGVRREVRNKLSREKLPVVLQVENDAAAGILVRVMDEATLGGAEAISINSAGS